MHRSGHVIIVQVISATDAAVRFLHCCLSAAMSFSVIHCLPDVFHSLLHLLIVGPLQFSPSIFCFGRPLDLFSFGDVHFWMVCRPSSVTHAQAIFNCI